MIKKELFPILEFDDTKTANLNPSNKMTNRFEYNRMIITFFSEVIDKLFEEGKIVKDVVIQSENPTQAYRFVDGTNIYIVLGQVGCPSCGGNLDIFNAMGINKVMFCGGGGVLDPSIDAGQMLLVDGAIRDDGFSYHYIRASRCIYANTATNEKISNYLYEKDIPYHRGLVWTTDAMYRETKQRIKLRRAEGARIVEMEQSGNFAVAQFRGFDYAAIIYGGDDCHSEEWSLRDWRSKKGMRYDLVMLCKELVQII